MVDDALRAKLDNLVTQEIIQGFRVVEVPSTVHRAVEEARQLDPTLPDIRRIRLSKLTPRKRAQVDEAVLVQYHSDLQKPHILSRSQIKKQNVERGEWSEAQEKKIEELQIQVAKLMEQLTVDGLDKEHKWQAELEEAANTYVKELEGSDKHPDEKAFLTRVFWRWANYTERERGIYTALYAQEQNKPEYMPEADLERLYNTAPSADAAEALSFIDETQFKLFQYKKLHDTRVELLELLGAKARMYEQSVETRRDNAEEMARLFYGTVVVDETGKMVGPIATSLEAFWEYPSELISWLIEEAYFFYNSIPRAIRGHLDDWGFTTAGRESGLLQLYDASPVPQSSKADISESAETPASSSESVLPTT